MTHWRNNNIDILLKELRAGNPTVRANAANLLGQLKDPATLDTLILAFREETYIDVRDDCMAVAIVRFGNIALPRVMDLIKDMDKYAAWENRSAAIRILGIMKNPTSATFLHSIATDPEEEYHSRESAIRALSKVANSYAVLDTYSSVLQENEPLRGWGLRKAVVEELGNLGKQGIPGAIELLKKALREEYHQDVVRAAQQSLKIAGE